MARSKPDIPPTPPFAAFKVWDVLQPRKMLPNALTGPEKWIYSVFSCIPMSRHEKKNVIYIIIVNDMCT